MLCVLPTVAHLPHPVFSELMSCSQVFINICSRAQAVLERPAVLPHKPCPDEETLQIVRRTSSLIKVIIDQDGISGNLFHRELANTF